MLQLGGSKSALAAAQPFARIALDFAERAVIATLFGGLVYRMATYYLASGNVSALLTIVSETMVVLLVLIRRPAQQISLRFSDWALAFIGTSALLLLRPASVHSPLLAQTAVVLQSVGIVGQLWCKAYLFRNFGIAPAFRGVSTKGPYGVVRHPMYAAYFVVELGYICAFPTLWNGAVLAIWTAAQFMRIEAEEKLLGMEPAYQAYRQKVRWRLFPGLY